MSNLLLNLLLAFVWMFVTGDFSPGSFLIGFGIGYVVLRVASPLLGRAGYDARFWYQLNLLGFFVLELFLSSLRVAAEVLTPGYGMKAGIISIPLDVESDMEITLLANLISLTPGTLSVDVSGDHRTLFIHHMYIDESVETSRRQIKDQLEWRIRRAVSGRAAERAVRDE